MSATGRNKAGHERSSRDKYVTPQWCIDLLISRISPLLAKCGAEWIIDPGCGDGRIGLSGLACFPAESDVNLLLIDPYVEESAKQLIRRTADRIKHSGLWGAEDQVTLVKRDFLKWSQNWAPKPGTVVLANPPFSLAADFVERAVVGMRAVLAVFLLRLDWLGSTKRADFLTAYPPKRITVLCPRPSFAHGANDSGEYGWIWWGEVPQAIEIARGPSQRGKRGSD